MGKARKLTDKQEKFCTKYIECLDMSEAYRYAYNTSRMKPTTVNIRAFELFNKSKIKVRINELKAERTKRTNIDADYVLNSLVEIREMDVADILLDNGDIKPIKEWPKIWRTTISGIDIASIMNGDVETVLKKIKWADKLKTVELIGKHVNVRAWDKAEDKSTDDNTSINITITNAEDIVFDK